MRAIGSFLVLGLVVCFSAMGLDQTEPTLRAIFYNNTSYIIEQPSLPITIDGAAPLSGYPWLEPRIFAIPPDYPPEVNPTIEVNGSIPPSYLFRPPGRVIPSPFDEATFQFGPSNRRGAYQYVARWPRLSNARDARNTVVLTLINRGRNIVFNTNFDLSYSVDSETIEKPSGTQTILVHLTPLKTNLSIIVRLRSQSTEAVAVEMIGDKADPPPSSHTSESIIWNVTNPPVGKTLAFTAQAAVTNLAYPTGARHVPGLLITASEPPDMLGTASGTSVEFPQEFLPTDIRGVRYSVSKKATWRFEYVDRTLVDIREMTELAP